jgi:transposase-like protein
VGWYVAYPLSLSHVDEMMQERGVFVDHSTVHRWAIKVLPVLAALFRKRKRPAGSSWRMDETYIKAAFLGHTSITRRNQIWRVRIMITI